jgi:hypothetical protein
MRCRGVAGVCQPGNELPMNPQRRGPGKHSKCQAPNPEGSSVCHSVGSQGPRLASTLPSFPDRQTPAGGGKELGFKWSLELRLLI